jgi:hypothetical protein
MQIRRMKEGGQSGAIASSQLAGGTDRISLEDARA